jgi:hypothetical protein
LAHELHGALYLNLKKIQISKPQKNSKKYLDVANCIHYVPANLQFEIPCIMSSAKITRKQIWEHEQFDFFFLPKFV